MQELLLLIDELEDTVEDAKSGPLPGHARVHRDDLYAIVAELRRGIPEEISQAGWIVRRREEMLAQAGREAEQTLNEAQQESDRLLRAEEVTKLAQRRAAQILDRARSPEREVRLAAEGYADEVLKSLETYLERFAAAVRRGHYRPRTTSEALGD